MVRRRASDCARMSKRTSAVSTEEFSAPSSTNFISMPARFSSASIVSRMDGRRRRLTRSP